VGFELTTSVVIGTDCIGSYKSNYHTITTTMAPTGNKPCVKHQNLKPQPLLSVQRMIISVDKDKNCI
jgi:hypothetical protein